MWSYSKNNGITEEFQRRIKLIQKRAYGYYPLRLLVECRGFDR